MSRFVGLVIACLLTMETAASALGPLSNNLVESVSMDQVPEPSGKPVVVIRRRDMASPQYVGQATTRGDVSILDHNPPDCDGCVAWADWDIRDYGVFEYVNYVIAENDAIEVIERQEVHGALIRNDADMSCSDPDRYTGEQVWTGNSGWVFNAHGVAIGPSGWKYGDNDTWVRTSGHTWIDDGAMWEVKGQLDRCIDL